MRVFRDLLLVLLAGYTLVPGYLVNEAAHLLAPSARHDGIIWSPIVDMTSAAARVRAVPEVLHFGQDWSEQ
jgi:hypothetical protein